jgi:threonine aldolase
MHKAGILAAAGLFALENHVERLRDDHANARSLAQGLEELDGIELRQARVQTNIVYFGIERTGLRSSELLSLLAPAGIRFKVVSEFTLRAATHLDIRAEDVDRVLDVLRTVLQEHSSISGYPG